MGYDGGVGLEGCPGVYAVSQGREGRVDASKSSGSLKISGEIGKECLPWRKSTGFEQVF